MVHKICILCFFVGGLENHTDCRFIVGCIPTYLVLPLQDVPLAGIVCSVSGPCAAVPTLAQWGRTGFFPEEAHAGSSGWSNWSFC